MSGGSVGVMDKPDVGVKRRVVAGVGRWAGVVRGGEKGGGRCAPPRLRGGARPGGRVRASTGPGVPSMFDSLEVKVLCPGLVETKG